jgi:signal transduction histidine kinase
MKNAQELAQRPTTKGAASRKDAIPNLGEAERAMLPLLRRSTDPKSLNGRGGPFRKLRILIDGVRNSWDIDKLQKDLTNKETAVRRELADLKKAQQEYMAEMETERAKLEGRNSAFEQRLADREQVIELQKHLLDRQKTELESLSARLEKMKLDAQKTVIQQRIRQNTISGFAAYAREEAIVIAVAEAERQQTLKLMSNFGEEMHELKNQIAVMILCGDGLVGTTTDPYPVKLIDRLRKSIKKANIVTDATLTEVKLVHGIIPLEKKKFNLSELLKEFAVERGAQAKEHGREVVFRTDENVFIDGDARRIEDNIFGNLVDNALKYGKCVTIDVKKNCTKVFVRVTDNGSGMDESVKISFMQRKKATSDRINGNGYGLTTARKIAELHGGSLELESEPGKGSTFIVTLPIASA